MPLWPSIVRKLFVTKEQGKSDLGVKQHKSYQCSKLMRQEACKFVPSVESLEKLVSDIESFYKTTNKRPVFQLGSRSKFIIISQAPGKKVNETGIPWNDASGRKLRAWLGVSEVMFYDPEIFSIIPMDFCYPGKGKHGDLPPDPDCAQRWHSKILSLMQNDPLKILIGQYAIQYYLGSNQKETLAETVRNYQLYLPQFFPMPHPSPRNQNWLKKNPWFENENIPFLKNYISQKINEPL